jgi:hypothetical protein
MRKREFRPATAQGVGFGLSRELWLVEVGIYCLLLVVSDRPV